MSAWVINTPLLEYGIAGKKGTDDLNLNKYTHTIWRVITMPRYLFSTYIHGLESF